MVRRFCCLGGARLRDGKCSPLVFNELGIVDVSLLFPIAASLAAAAASASGAGTV